MKIEPEKNDKKPLYPVIAVAAVGALLALSSCQQTGTPDRIPITTGGK